MIERIIHPGFVTIIADELGIITCGTFLVLKAFPVPTGLPHKDWMQGYEYICRLENMGYITSIKSDSMIVAKT
ncbi:MAG TPA: hypothetical protein VIY48_08915 [Candidatus Paceibacterota bacterium]